MKRRGIYLALFTDLERDSCFSIYQNSWIKTKTATFCKLKTSLSRNSLLTIYKHFGDFVKCLLRFCCKFSIKIIFHLPVGTDKFVAFLLFVCTTTSFIAQISSSENLETRGHLGSGRKTVNSQGYSELREPIKTCKNCYSLIW